MQKNSIDYLLLSGSKTLSSFATSHIDTEVILGFVLNRSKTFLYTHPHHTVTKSQEERFFQLIKKRQTKIPIAYITGKKEFYGRDFFVNKNTLIPRPETEELVDEVLEFLQVYNMGKTSVADIGTGSGCIATTIKKENPKLILYASDISDKAVEAAKKNAKNLNAKIILKKGDLLTPLKKIKINIIVANLPYISADHMKSLKNTPVSFEPKKALSGGKDGLNLYKKLFFQIKKYKQNPNAIFCEIEPVQKSGFTRYAKKYLPGYNLIFKKDLAGNLRFAKISR